MGKVDEFKEFVKKNPKLVKYVKSGESNWQKFYEIYDLYGDNNEAWKDYLDVEIAATSGAALTDLFGWLKNLNLDSIQSGVNNLQRVLGVVQDLKGSDNSKPTNEYKPRPMYKHFED